MLSLSRLCRVCPGCVEFVQVVLRVCPGCVEFVEVVLSLYRLC